MSSPCKQPMDFEQWIRLATQDPEGFEAMRLDMIEELIGAASLRCQQRLRGLQWRIDRVRELAPNPLAACLTLSGMMWETFAGDGGLVQTLNRRDYGERELPPPIIIPFPRCKD